MSGIEFILNGTLIKEEAAAPNTTLLNYLRASGRTGTKEGCAEGDCGACTVVIIDPHGPGGPAYRAINSCLVLLPMVHQKQIYTVEGLKEGSNYHPVQKALVEKLGSQCGYCTPGVIMSMFEACYRTDLDEDWKLDDQMCGNLCRCTGYRPIREATQQIAGQRPEDSFSQALREELPAVETIDYQADDQRFFMPASFEELFKHLQEFPKGRIIAGGTDLSLLITKQFQELSHLVSLDSLNELQKLEEQEDGFWVGAGVRLGRLERSLAEALPPLARMLRFFGARQIKNRATVGGNLCNASPIGDLPPVLISLKAEAVIRGPEGQRRVAMEDFFADYRKTVLKPAEILEAVFIPKLASDDISAAAYKVSKRQELDISTVSLGAYIQREDGKISEARLAYGGMAATPLRAQKTEAALIGKEWTLENLEAALVHLEDDFKPIADHRGSAWYRKTLAANLLKGFYLETRSQSLPVLPYRPTGTIIAGQEKNS